MHKDRHPEHSLFCSMRCSDIISPSSLKACCHWHRSDQLASTGARGPDKMAVKFRVHSEQGLGNKEVLMGGEIPHCVLASLQTQPYRMMLVNAKPGFLRFGRKLMEGSVCQSRAVALSMCNCCSGSAQQTLFGWLEVLNDSYQHTLACLF